MDDDRRTVAEAIRDTDGQLTRAERQLTDAILENYPISGLGSITALAEKSAVSTPTVARLVQKLGFRGFPDFQAALRDELAAQISDPIARRSAGGVAEAPDDHPLKGFEAAAARNITQSTAHLGVEAFDECRALFSDLDRSVFVIGGRVTRMLAEYFAQHLQIIRPRIAHVVSNNTAWPHHALDVKPHDIVVIFDVRRYENTTLRFAQFCHARGAETVLVTDQWRSPCEKYAAHVLHARTAAPSPWDSLVAPLMLTEALLAAIAADLWPQTHERIEALERMFDQTQMFRKFT